MTKAPFQVRENKAKSIEDLLNSEEAEAFVSQGRSKEGSEKPAKAVSKEKAKAPKAKENEIYPWNSDPMNTRLPAGYNFKHNQAVSEMLSYVVKNSPDYSSKQKFLDAAVKALLEQELKKLGIAKGDCSATLDTLK
ncbi:hypothetical protein [Aestuariispira insulae]|uniref:Uncharacterized protein n=1 Tax=Aestuariispira insulae TaxID=1461337 RepID=A0A3D9H3P2_9PROT|nr:hypothetical protein [Aestuariispira insulae]RED44105.1 hypothetical protein DFP90_1178 [Aestuariispira insulae]